MKLFESNIRKDYGVDWIFSILKTNRWSLFQLCVSLSEYSGGPYLQINSGMGRLFGFIFSVGKFGVTFDIIGHTWNYDLHL